MFLHIRSNSNLVLVWCEDGSLFSILYIVFEVIKEQEKTNHQELESKAAEYKALKAQAETERQKVIYDEQKKLVQLQAHIKSQVARYSDDLARKRMLAENEHHRERNRELVKMQEESTMRQEALRRATEEQIQAQLRQTEKLKSQLARETLRQQSMAEAEGRAHEATLGEEVNKSLLIERAKAEREKWVAAINMTFDHIGDQSKMIVAVGGLTALACGVYTTREGARVLWSYVDRILGQPSLIRESSRGKYPWSGFFSRARSSGNGNGFGDVILHPSLQKPIQQLAKATANTKAHQAPFRNMLLYGPPGTGKTMVARELACKSGLDYALMTGRDVAPLGSQAVTKIHQLLDWSKKSNRGLLLFIDEADAFLCDRLPRRKTPSFLSTRHYLSTTACPSSKLRTEYSFVSPPSLHPQTPLKNTNFQSGPESQTRKPPKPAYRPPSSLDMSDPPIRSDLPFDFRFSYTESSTRVRPIGLRGPKYSPFGPGRVAREWTGVCAPAVDPRVVSPGVDGELEEKRLLMRERVQGEPLTNAERKALVERCQRPKTKRQINLGRDGLTHNMLSDIHNNWKHAEAVRIKCMGVPTVDMKNICTQLEDKTFGQIIQRHGGLLVLYRGRYYNPKERPVIPLMLWKPQEPVYPRLIKTTIDGLSIEETKEMRKRGLLVPALTRPAKNGYYGSLVPMVRDAFLCDELVRVDCKGLPKSDYKKIGCKLRDLVPCILVTFQREQIVIWRGKDYKPAEGGYFLRERELFDDPDKDPSDGPCVNEIVDKRQDKTYIDSGDSDDE